MYVHALHKFYGTSASLRKNSEELPSQVFLRHLLNQSENPDDFRARGPKDSTHKDETLLANTLCLLPGDSTMDIASAGPFPQQVLSPKSQFLFKGSKARMTVKSQLDHREKTDADLLMCFVAGPINAEFQTVQV